MGEHRTKDPGRRKDAVTSTKKVVIGSGARQSPSRVFTSRQPLLIGLVVIVVTAIIAFVVAKQQRLPSDISAVCTDTIAQEATGYNKLGNETGLTQLVYRIREKPNYAKDPNCLYIITQYQILTSRLDTAKANIEKLQTVYGAKYTFNKQLDDGKASVDKLRGQLELMQNALDNSKGKIDPDI